MWGQLTSKETPDGRGHHGLESSLLQMTMCTYSTGPCSSTSISTSSLLFVLVTSTSNYFVLSSTLPLTLTSDLHV